MTIMEGTMTVAQLREDFTIDSLTDLEPLEAVTRIVNHQLETCSGDEGRATRALAQLLSTRPKLRWIMARLAFDVVKLNTDGDHIIHTNQSVVTNASPSVPNPDVDHKSGVAQATERPASASGPNPDAGQRTVVSSETCLSPPASGSNSSCDQKGDDASASILISSQLESSQQGEGHQTTIADSDQAHAASPYSPTLRDDHRIGVANCDHTVIVTPEAPQRNGSDHGVGAAQETDNTPSSPVPPTQRPINPFSQSRLNALIKSKMAVSDVVFQLHDGKSIMDVTFGSLEYYRKTGAIQAEVADRIMRHARNPRADVKVSEVISPGKLREIMASASKDVGDFYANA